jgi:hypothetical protein
MTNLLLLLLLLPVCGVVYGMTRYKLVLAGATIVGSLRSTATI